MKKLIIALVLTLSFTPLISQNEVVIEVNKEIFTSNVGVTYYSEDKKATLIAMMLPMNFDDMIEDAQKDKTLGKNVETGFILDKTVFFINEIEDRDNEEYMFAAFIKKNIDGNIISIMTGFPLSEKETYYSSIIEAVKSAKTRE